jgi:hypothetical protein
LDRVSIFNRRNAAIGWLAWNAAKIILRHKAKDVVPKVDRDRRRPNKSAIALLLAGTVAAAAFWHRRRRDDDPFAD